MRNAKKVFWFSIIVFIASTILVIVSSCWEDDKNRWDIVINIFIGLVGGAFLSAATTSISFMQIKKDYEIKFYSHVNTLNNLLFRILNWYNWNYDKIDYKKTIDTSNLTMEQAKEAHHFVFDNMDNMVKDYISLVVDFKEYNYDEMIYILDDYRGLFCNKNNKIKRTMIELRNELNKYNINYYPSMINSYTLYEMGKYPEVAVYNDIVTPFLQQTNIRCEKLQNLLSLRKKYLELTNLVEYTKKQQ